MKTLGGLLIALVGAAFIGLIVAALWHLDVSLSAKVLIALLFLMLGATTALLSSLIDTNNKAALVQRLTFISLERARPHAEDPTPALEILKADLEDEKLEENVLRFFQHPWERWLTLTVALGLIVLSAAIFIASWQALETLLG